MVDINPTRFIKSELKAEYGNKKFYYSTNAGKNKSNPTKVSVFNSPIKGFFGSKPIAEIDLSYHGDKSLSGAEFKFEKDSAHVGFDKTKEYKDIDPSKNRFENKTTLTQSNSGETLEEYSIDKNKNEVTKTFIYEGTGEDKKLASRTELHRDLKWDNPRTSLYEDKTPEDNAWDKLTQKFPDLKTTSVFLNPNQHPDTKDYCWTEETSINQETGVKTTAIRTNPDQEGWDKIIDESPDGTITEFRNDQTEKTVTAPDGTKTEFVYDDNGWQEVKPEAVKQPIVNIEPRGRKKAISTPEEAKPANPYASLVEGFKNFGNAFLNAAKAQAGDSEVKPAAPETAADVSPAKSPFPGSNKPTSLEPTPIPADAVSTLKPNAVEAQKEVQEIKSKPSEATVTESANKHTTHEVKKGDSLWKLTQDSMKELNKDDHFKKISDSGFHMALCEIVAEYNGLDDPNMIKVGQELKMPDIDSIKAKLEEYDGKDKKIEIKDINGNGVNATY